MNLKCGIAIKEGLCIQLTILKKSINSYFYYKIADKGVMNYPVDMISRRLFNNTFHFSTPYKNTIMEFTLFTGALSFMKMVP